MIVKLGNQMRHSVSAEEGEYVIIAQYLDHLRNLAPKEAQAHARNRQYRSPCRGGIPFGLPKAHDACRRLSLKTRAPFPLPPVCYLRARAISSVRSSDCSPLVNRCTLVRTVSTISLTDRLP